MKLNTLLLKLFLVLFLNVYFCSGNKYMVKTTHKKKSKHDGPCHGIRPRHYLEDEDDEDKNE